MDIIEILGYTALTFSIISFLFKSDITFRQLQLIANFIFAIHFFGMGNSFVGAISCLIATLSLAVNLYNDKSRLNNIFPCLYALILFYALYSFNIEKWHEIVPAIANIAFCYAYLFCKGQKTNTFILLGVCLWVIYAFQVGSTSSLITQFVVLGFLISRMIRMQIDINSKQNKI